MRALSARVHFIQPDHFVQTEGSAFAGQARFNTAAVQHNPIAKFSHDVGRNQERGARFFVCLFYSTCKIDCVSYRGHLLRTGDSNSTHHNLSVMDSNANIESSLIHHLEIGIERLEFLQHLQPCLDGLECDIGVVIQTKERQQAIANVVAGKRSCPA